MCIGIVKIVWQLPIFIIINDLYILRKIKDTAFVLCTLQLRKKDQ